MLYIAKLYRRIALPSFLINCFGQELIGKLVFLAENESIKKIKAKRGPNRPKTGYRGITLPSRRPAKIFFKSIRAGQKYIFLSALSFFLRFGDVFACFRPFWGLWRPQIFFVQSAFGPKYSFSYPRRPKLMNKTRRQCDSTVKREKFAKTDL